MCKVAVVAGVDDDELPDPPPRASAVHGASTSELVGLGCFVCTGVAIGQCFEVLQIHAGPAEYETFFLAVLGYWAQLLVGGTAVLASGSRERAADC